MSDTTTSTEAPSLDYVFNIGVKAPDAEAEAKFFQAFNPDRAFIMDRSRTTSGPKAVPAVEFGNLKFFLFSKLAYDDDLEVERPGGNSHIAFMVKDLDALVSHLSKKGIEPFKGPYSVDVGDLGKRKVAFYKSPNGTLLEPQELLS